MSDLINCRCGGEAKYSNEWGRRGVRCSVCGISYRPASCDPEQGREESKRVWNTRPTEDALQARIDELEADRKLAELQNKVLREKIEQSAMRNNDLTAQVKELREALSALVNCKALSSVRSLVAGWNGENAKDGPHEPHPARLGANIRTNCGQVYELDRLLVAGKEALASTAYDFPDFAKKQWTVSEETQAYMDAVALANTGEAG